MASEVIIRNNIPNLTKILNANTRQCLIRIGYFCKDKMNYYVPRKTGFLASRNTFTISGNFLNLRNDCSYAGYQEFGTYKMAAHPFMKPAVFNHLNEITNIAKETLSNGI